MYWNMESKSANSGGREAMNNEGVAGIICITVLIILFGGDPDLADAVIHWLMQ